MLQSDKSLLTAGTTVAVNTGTVAVPAWTDVAGVTDIGGAGSERPLIRATDLVDTVEKYHAGRKDGTEINLEMRVVFASEDLDPGQACLRDAYDDGSEVEMKVTYPNLATREFTVLVRSWPEAVNDGEHLTVSATLKVISDITRVEPVQA